MPAPPADATKLLQLRSAIGPRPVIAAASTHPGEDIELIDVHRKLKHSFPGLLTILLLFVLATCAFGVCSLAAAPDAEPSIPYRTRLKGLWFGELKNAVREQSLSMSLIEHPPATARQLRMRAEDDIPAMTAVLKAGGYLDATILLEVDTNRSPVRVTFRALKGPQYTIRSFHVVYTNTSDNVPPFPGRLGLKRRSRAAVESVETAEASALRFLQERGYPSPQKLGRTVTRDDVHRTVAVVCTVDPGPQARLGAAVIRGLDRLHSGYMRRRIRWSPGDPG